MELCVLHCFVGKETENFLTRFLLRNSSKKDIKKTEGKEINDLA